jgi:hypothetical protein
MATTQAMLRARMEQRLAILPRDDLISLLAEACAQHNRTRAKADAVLCKYEPAPPQLQGDQLETCLKLAGMFATFRAMRVCHDWRAVALRPSLHTNIELKNPSVSFSHRHLHHSHSYSLSGPQQLSEGPDTTNVSQWGLPRIITLAAGQLERLSLANFSSVTAESLAPLRSQSHLRILDISDCKRVTAKVLQYIPPTTLNICLWHCSTSLDTCSLHPLESTVGRCSHCKTVVSHAPQATAPNAPAASELEEVSWLRKCPQPGCNESFCTGNDNSCVSEGLDQCAKCSKFYVNRHGMHWDNTVGSHLQHETWTALCDVCDEAYCSECVPCLACTKCPGSLCMPCFQDPPKLDRYYTCGIGDCGGVGDCDLVLLE